MELLQVGRGTPGGTDSAASSAPKHVPFVGLETGLFALSIAPGFHLHTQQADSGLPAHTGLHMLTEEHTHTHVWARTLAETLPVKAHHPWSKELA